MDEAVLPTSTTTVADRPPSFATSSNSRILSENGLTKNMELPLGNSSPQDVPKGGSAVTQSGENTVPERTSADQGSPATQPHANISSTFQSRSLTSVAESNMEQQPNHRSPSPRTPSTVATNYHTTRSTDTDRSRRRRSALDFRAGPRLSELFSNFIHRRQDQENTAPQSEHSARHESFPRENIVTPTIGAPKAEPPPPSLPSPTLADLGLSMSVLTANLIPSHLSSLPTSGTFLAPHYLLLCHPQGLDVLPLVSPPAPEPFAIIRRVSFKSVVVMEGRGVLIAIAGKRDGVRVYALDELRRVIEWRLDLETRKERERIRKEDLKKLSGKVDQVFGAIPMTPEPKDETQQPITVFGKAQEQRLHRRSSLTSQQQSVQAPSSVVNDILERNASDTPPSYDTSNVAANTHTSSPIPRSSSILSSDNMRARSGSVSTVTRTTLEESGTGTEIKGEWMEVSGSSDDEAINPAAAGASGSAALDERTSSMARGNANETGLSVRINNDSQPPSFRNLRSQSVAVISPVSENGPSAAAGVLSRVATSPPLSSNQLHAMPTLQTIRHSLQSSPRGGTVSLPPGPDEDIGSRNGENDLLVDDDDDGDDANGEISLAQALLESRIPNLPPPGTRIQQQVILIDSTSTPSPASMFLEGTNTPDRVSFDSAPPSPMARGSRRRWSILGSPSNHDRRRADESRNPAVPLSPLAHVTPPSPSPQNRLTRSQSSRGHVSISPFRRHVPTHAHSSSSPNAMPPQSNHVPAPRRPNTTATSSDLPGSTLRFIPRIFSAALGSRRSEENVRHNAKKGIDKETTKGLSHYSGTTTTPQPKLDSVKLPGTKGSVLIKAVETSRKSFLAILCGEAGEKVELFAGTWRTALSLSRTFILPDSPRSLELQVQGDDLVEIFLVFSQNVFGLEPATVRVREVRIGRAERRAARRRAREGHVVGGDETPTAPEDDTNVSVSIGIVAGEQGSSEVIGGQEEIGRGNTGDEPDPPASLPTITVSDPQELMAIAAAQTAPYTTFQQLSFAPVFPLAILGDEVIIPPSYPSFMRHRDEHENGGNGSTNELAVQHFAPPGLLPPPVSAPQYKWFYRDPKGVVQGPWKAALMHSWYKDGLLPMDLPVRRDTDTEFILLRDLRAQSLDPEYPFRQHAPSGSGNIVQTPVIMEAKPLLPPVSILEQPRHFGPPPLFFSSRGGHSTAIVDAKGRSVLKGRFMWSVDEDDVDTPTMFGKLGDVKRLEAFDVQNRAVIVALRQGGLEAVDVGDALYKPADESRSYIPLFHTPASGFNRRGSYIWRIGGPLAVPHTASPVSSWASAGPPLKKISNGLLRSPGRSEFAVSSDDIECNGQEEVLFLGRRGDDIYLCERNAMSYRILRLSPS